MKRILTSLFIMALLSSAGRGEDQAETCRNRRPQTSAASAETYAVSNGFPVKVRSAKTATRVVNNFSLSGEALETHHYVVVEAQIPWSRLPIREGPENMKDYANFSGGSTTDLLYRFRAVALTEFTLSTTNADTYECFALGRYSGNEAWAMASGGKWVLSETPAMVRLAVNGKVPISISNVGTREYHTVAFNAYDDPDEAILLAFIVPKTVPLERLFLKFANDKPVPLKESHQ